MPADDPPSIDVHAPDPVPRRHGRRLSEILTGLAEDPSRERISIADLIASMRDRTFGALMVLFALPNILPTPPGTSAILGAPLIILAAQMAVGLPPWLPRLIAERSINRGDFAAIVTRAVPWLNRAEKLLSPRLTFLTHPPAENIVGFVCLLLAIVLALPIPLGNMLPALAICCFSLGILERDGIWVIAGLVTAVASVTLVWGVFYTVIKGAFFLLANAFS
ncbi:ABC transporter permease [Rhodospirillum rubrum]|uniref:exopolysaccharide biosynthesis protein n=1 Tax=Rhodospirillum rubrum TaxID=1085 RepID=UPI001908B0B7|nr:exopolysaccharide biosynthesis protein [Rhodospirillum rubrum]MBK1663873.1 ABC transporter permease [Rhodospirillum rubrum]MBK1675883.1 ABC transporter permease [Rhodospirillum rubrum]